MRCRFCTVTPPVVNGAGRHREERRSATGRGQGRAPLARRGDLMPLTIRPRQRHEIASAFAPTPSGRRPRTDPFGCASFFFKLRRAARRQGTQ